MRRYSGDWGPNTDDDDDEPTVGPKSEQAKIKRLAMDMAQREVGAASDWERYVDQVKGDVSWENFEAFLKKKGWERTDIFDYVSPSGFPLYQALRYKFSALPSEKKFQLRHKDSDDKWVHGRGPVSVPYRLPELIAGKGRPIILCEGEKDANRAIREGLRATSVQGQNWADSVTSFFIGEEVIIVPDNDDAGRENAEKAIEWLRRVGARVRVLELEGLGPRGDLSDWFDAGHTADELLSLAEQVPPESNAGNLKVINPASWEGKPIPEREWVVENFIPTGTVGFIYGDGGTGKSLLMLMLSVSRAAAIPWLGMAARPGRTLYISCEDDEDELHRRLNAIRVHHNLDFAALDAIRIIDLVGQDTVLGELKKNGTIDATSLYRAVARQVTRHDAEFVVIDSLANVFSGDENNRTQARQFVSMLTKLVLRGRTVAVLAHPSLSGINTGRGTSGSTAWGNSGRWRAYFAKSNDKDSDPDEELRELSVAKSNYGPANFKITMRWENGIYVPVDPASSEVAKSKASYAFINLLTRFRDEGRDVSHKTGPTYAPAVFAKEPEAREQRIKKDQFEVAMAVLLKLKRVAVEEFGPTSKRRSRLILREVANEEPF